MEVMNQLQGPSGVIANAVGAIRSLTRWELMDLLSWHNIPFGDDDTKDRLVMIAESTGREWPVGWTPGPPPGWHHGKPRPGEENVSRETEEVETSDDDEDSS